MNGASVLFSSISRYFRQNAQLTGTRPSTPDYQIFESDLGSMQQKNEAEKVENKETTKSFSDNLRVKILNKEINKGFEQQDKQLQKSEDYVTPTLNSTSNRKNVYINEMIKPFSDNFMVKISDEDLKIINNFAKESIKKPFTNIINHSHLGIFIKLENIAVHDKNDHVTVIIKKCKAKLLEVIESELRAKLNNSPLKQESDVQPQEKKLPLFSILKGGACLSVVILNGIISFFDGNAVFVSGQSIFSAILGAASPISYILGFILSIVDTFVQVKSEIGMVSGAMGVSNFNNAKECLQYDESEISSINKIHLLMLQITKRENACESEKDIEDYNNISEQLNVIITNKLNSFKTKLPENARTKWLKALINVLNVITAVANSYFTMMSLIMGFGLTLGSLSVLVFFMVGVSFSFIAFMSQSDYVVNMFFPELEECKNLKKKVEELILNKVTFNKNNLTKRRHSI